jgi:hypothetical protein
MRIVIAGVITALLLAACGEQKKDVKDTVFAPQVEVLDKARAVQDRLKQGEQKKREVIEASERLGQTSY